ncbi:MAG: carboxylating nicotinate-nucleotide diphosphorylase [Candidatus Hodarchaeota archaeon]
MSYNKFILEKKIREFLIEDCNYTDVSSKFINNEAQTSSRIIVKSDGYVSGLEEIKILYSLLSVSVNLLKKDADEVKKGDVIVLLNGKVKNILLGERVGLNLITHMSSITSTVRDFVKKINNSGKNVKIACTRKTIPGMRIFEKKAAEYGQADPHRFSLDDMILLKDTHLRYYNGNVENLLKDVKKTASFTKKIEIEIEKVNDVLIAAENGADVIMLDNMNPDMVEDAINLLKKSNLREKVIIEISGGITLENIIDYLISEPDIISIGEITQFPSHKMDFSLRFD